MAILAPSGEERRRVSLLNALRQSDFNRFWAGRRRRTGDVFHTNSLDVLREGPAARIQGFRPGRVLVSMRNLSLLAVLDMELERIVWALEGGFRLQHSAQLLENGHILLFDNRGLRRRSRILELDAATGEPEWEYRADEGSSFFSRTRGPVQRLANGNTLITESDRGRAFEVTPDGEIVWEYFNPSRAGSEGEFIAALLEVRRLPPGFPTDWMGDCPGS